MATRTAERPADEVVAEIRAAGGEAIANIDDVADWEGGARIVEAAIDAFGRLDAVVNNAGFVRDRMFVSCTPEEWDAVIRVHLRGHFCVIAPRGRSLARRGEGRADRSTRVSSTPRPAPACRVRSARAPTRRRRPASRR